MASKGQFAYTGRIPRPKMSYAEKKARALRKVLKPPKLAGIGLKRR